MVIDLYKKNVIFDSCGISGSDGDDNNENVHVVMEKLLSFTLLFAKESLSLKRKINSFENREKSVQKSKVHLDDYCGAKELFDVIFKLIICSLKWILLKMKTEF